MLLVMAKAMLVTFGVLSIVVLALLVSSMDDRYRDGGDGDI